MKKILFTFLFALAVVIPALAAPSAPTAVTTLPRQSNHAVIYRIMSTDKLSVRIFQEDDLSTISRVDANGTINLQLIGPIRVMGQTLQEAQKTIETAYHDGRYLRDPQVTVSVEDYAPREVSIQGQVKAPARYPLPIESTMSLIDLVTKAGGFTDSAKGTAVRLSRVLPDGTIKVFTIDVDSLIRGKEKGKTQDSEDSSMLLEPNDVVYVPERVI